MAGIDTNVFFNLHFDNDVVDSGLSQRTLTNTGGTFSSGKFNNSVYIGGNGKCVDAPYSADLTFSGDFTIDFFTTSATAGSRGTNYSAIMYLNYVSDKSTLPGGSANHPHTVIPWFCSHGAGSLVTTITRQPISIPEDDKWLS